ncbi:DUF2975 domain-containing protein [Plantactinospora sp. S1510]|uniref:DUF2975 domain-containing protein n=1 Tax=Plantactinospora alkalitolerans TaxID=2789879 RepID=A0ABS0GWE5_9ACTN|nr:DUF2975 domain-containing protein [Plantactinospora alkalitolerans]MBF9130534.1 DUF2975 domain-containing protein [Plantactinospora alkalitolerans]
MSFLEKLRKPDWLGEMQALLVLGLVGTGLAVVLTGGRTVLGDSPVTVQLPAEAMTDVAGPVAGTADGISIGPDSIVEVQIADPSVHQVVAEAMTGLPTLLVVLGMLLMLLRTVRRARRGDPFTVGTVRRLRVLAVLLIAGGVAAGIVESLAALDLSRTIGNETVYTVWQPPAGWLLAGFGLLAIAEVVNRGVVMRDELDRVI